MQVGVVLVFVLMMRVESKGSLLFRMYLMCLLLSQVLYGVNEKLANEDVDSPLCAVRPVKKVLLTCVTGDRGLCGGYNSFVIRKVTWCTASLGLSMAFVETADSMLILVRFRCTD